MAIELDHLILAVNDVDASVEFYVRTLSLVHEGARGPFQVLRVTPDFVLQLAPWGTKGGEHLAFALDAASFDAAFARLKADGIPYGDSFHSADNRKGPGVEGGARGDEPSLYFFDPNRHLLEIRRRA